MANTESLLPHSDNVSAGIENLFRFTDSMCAAARGSRIPDIAIVRLDDCTVQRRSCVCIGRRFHTISTVVFPCFAALCCFLLDGRGARKTPHRKTDDNRGEVRVSMEAVCF